MKIKQTWSAMRTIVLPIAGSMPRSSHSPVNKLATCGGFECLNWTVPSLTPRNVSNRRLSILDILVIQNAYGLKRTWRMRVSIPVQQCTSLFNAFISDFSYPGSLDGSYNQEYMISAHAKTNTATAP